MQAVGEPDINVDYHAARPDGSECRFADRHRMLAESAIEFLVEEHAVLPKLGRCSSSILLDMVISVLTKPPRLLICAPAGRHRRLGCTRKSGGLELSLAVGRAADGKAHIAEPDAHAAAQLDLAGLRANRLAL